MGVSQLTGGEQGMQTRRRRLRRPVFRLGQPRNDEVAEGGLNY